jgi:hypothetical protein
MDLMPVLLLLLLPFLLLEPVHQLHQPPVLLIGAPF